MNRHLHSNDSQKKCIWNAFFPNYCSKERFKRNLGQNDCPKIPSRTFFPSLKIWPTNMNVLSQFWQMSPSDDDKGASQSPPKVNTNNTFTAKPSSMTKSRY